MRLSLRWIDSSNFWINCGLEDQYCDVLPPSADLLELFLQQGLPSLPEKVVRMVHTRRLLCGDNQAGRWSQQVWLAMLVNLRRNSILDYLESEPFDDRL